MNIYYAIGRWISPLIMKFLRLYGRLSKAVRPRIMVINAQHEVLLVKSWVGPQKWELPGGAAQKQETVEEAAVRELKEELGLTVSTKKLRHVVTLYGAYETPFFLVRLTPQVIRPRRLEITAWKWYPLSDLPEECTQQTVIALKNVSLS